MNSLHWNALILQHAGCTAGCRRGLLRRRQAVFAEPASFRLGSMSVIITVVMSLPQQLALPHFQP